MNHGESNLLQILQNLMPVGLVALAGGILDYLYALQTQKKVWSLLGFLVHLGVSVFAGCMVSLLVVGLGYDVTIAGAAAGAAGFLNIRLIDLLFAIVKSKPEKH